MSLSEKQIGELTLDELETISKRFASAISTIQEAQRMLGVASPQVQPAQAQQVAIQNTQNTHPELQAWRNSPERQALLDSMRDTQKKDEKELRPYG